MRLFLLCRQEQAESAPLWEPSLSFSLFCVDKSKQSVSHFGNLSYRELTRILYFFCRQVQAEPGRLWEPAEPDEQAGGGRQGLRHPGFLQG